MIINIVTGNHNKLLELRRVFPESLELIATKLDLDEIQTLDTRELVGHKLRQAFDILKQPVIVEDVSAELASLNGLPGPFVKFFEERLGRSALYQLGGEGDRVKIICTMGFFDGEKELVIEGIVNGTIVAPRGEDGFGFDSVVMPDGYSQTFAEMTADEKNQISHRSKAAAKLAALLQA